MVKRSRIQQACCNKTVPADSTDKFRELIMALPASVKADYLKSQIFSKFVSDDTAPPSLRMERAVAKWLATEVKNHETNLRLKHLPLAFNILPRVTYGSFMAFCRDLIVKIIGEQPPVEALIGSFSGGASTSRNRTESHPAGKYLGEAHVTQECLDLFINSIVGELPGWFCERNELLVEHVPGNVMFTVPKNTDIDRPACKEPDLNMFVQKGIGNYIRKRLRRVNINLNDQSINRSLAQIGSIDGRLATLDLSSASDSISTGLVAEMLPESWFTLLNSVRSKVTRLPTGEMHRNEMFSSMGNGFTFELESLLFYVLARATAYFRGISGIISIYGDDIICPSAVVPELIFVLGLFGFSVNPDKSFWSGTFRESCGGHYDLGVDITPFYVKGPLSTYVDIIHAANQLREWATIPGLGILNPEVEDIWLWLKSLVPSVLWGGVDTSFKYQLVSYDPPCKRLQQEKKKRKTGIGGYIHWLNATWDRTGPIHEAVVTSSMSEDREKFRLRPARTSTVTPLPAGYFYHEVVR